MTRATKLTIGAIAVPVVVVGALVVTRPGPEGQAERLLEDIQRRIEDGRPGELVQLLHPDYRLLEHFPVLDFIHDEAVAQTEGTDADLQRVFRETVRVQANRWAFAQRQAGPPVMTWRIHEVGEPDADGTFELVASISIDGLRPAPSLTSHRFVLSTAGWFRPVALIRDHDPINLN